MDTIKKNFLIGGLVLNIEFEQECTGFSLIPSFANFEVFDKDLFPDIRIKVGDFSNNEQYTFVDKTEICDGYVVIEKSGERYCCKFFDELMSPCSIIEGNEDYSICNCNIIGDDYHKSLGLNNALKTIYLYAASFKNRTLLHSSVVKHKGKACCFIGESGRGKSTQSALWVKNIPDCSIINDDMPILYVEDDGRVVVYGSPWSGKTNYYIKDSAEMRALVMMSQGNKNVIEKSDMFDSISYLLQSCSSFYPSETSRNKTLDIIDKILSKYPVYSLSCLPDAESAILCCKTVFG